MVVFPACKMTVVADRASDTLTITYSGSYAGYAKANHDAGAAQCTEASQLIQCGGKTVNLDMEIEVVSN